MAFFVRAQRNRALVLFSTFALVACSSEKTEFPVVQSPSEQESALLPSQWFEDHLEELLGNYRFVLESKVETCMTASGFVYQVGPLSADPASPHLLGRYGQAIAQTPGRSTYAPESSDIDGPPIADPNSGAADAAYLLALNGKAELVERRSIVSKYGTQEILLGQGCMGKAIAEIFGSHDEYEAYLQSFSNVEDFSNESREVLYASSDFVSINEQWASCMKLQGENRFLSPDDAASFDWRDQPDQEVVYSADLGCQEMVNYTPRLSSLELDWQELNSDRLVPNLTLVQADYDHLKVLATSLR